MTCGQCIYFQPAGQPVRSDDGRKIDAGRCRRNPPTAINPQRSTYPLVHVEMWCGEWRAAS